MAYVVVMWCIACGRPSGPLCASCVDSLRPGHTSVVGNSLAVAPFAHRGAAARLVRLMKYRRLMAAASYLVDAMAELVPPDASCLVPVPRAVVRRARYGIDPAGVLAAGLAARTGIPMVEALKGPVWWPQRAGRGRSRRSPVRFRNSRTVPVRAVLVDDVLTTGATMLGALVAVDPTRDRGVRVLTATSVGTMRHGANTAPNLGGDVASKSPRIGLRPAAGSATAPHPLAHPRKESE